MSSLRPAIPKTLWRILMGSFAAHVGLLLVAALAGMGSAPPAPIPLNYIPTKLVRLGKKRPPELLPNVERQAAPPPKPDVNLTSPLNQPTTAQKPQAALDALDRAKEASRVSSALDRLKRTGEPSELEGDPDGVQDGDVSDLSQAIEGNKYLAEIDRCLRSNYTIEGIDRQKAQNRKAQVLVRIQPDGVLFGSKILKGSGLPAFDRAVERAVKKCAKVSPPPDGLRDIVQSEGLEIRFKP